MSKIPLSTLPANLVDYVDMNVKLIWDLLPREHQIHELQQAREKLEKPTSFQKYCREHKEEMDGVINAVRTEVARMNYYMRLLFGRALSDEELLEYFCAEHGMTLRDAGRLIPAQVIEILKAAWEKRGSITVLPPDNSIDNAIAFVRRHEADFGDDYFPCLERLTGKGGAQRTAQTAGPNETGERATGKTKGKHIDASVLALDDEESSNGGCTMSEQEKDHSIPIISDTGEILEDFDPNGDGVICVSSWNPNYYSGSGPCISPCRSVIETQTDPKTGEIKAHRGWRLEYYFGRLYRLSDSRFCYCYMDNDRPTPLFCGRFLSPREAAGLLVVGSISPPKDLNLPEATSADIQAIRSRLGRYSPDLILSLAFWESSSSQAAATGWPRESADAPVDVRERTPSLDEGSGAHPDQKAPPDQLAALTNAESGGQLPADCVQTATNGQPTCSTVQPVSTDDLQAMIAAVGDENTIAIFRIAQDVSKTADEKMRAIHVLDRRFLGWNSPKWAKLLQVTPDAIRQTHWWKVDRKDVIESEKLKDEGA